MSSTLIRAARQITSRAVARPLAAARLESTRFYSSTVHDNDPDTLEREKRKNLSGKQHKTSSPHEHAPGWNEYLASASEAAVKADGDRSDGGPEGLQKKTTEHIRARYEADEDDSTDGNTQAGQEFQKETVRGPLGSAKGNVAKPKSRSGGVAGGKP